MAKIPDEDLEIKEIVPQSMLIEFLRLKNRVEFVGQSVRRSLEEGATVEKGDVTAELQTVMTCRPAWKQIVIEKLGKDEADKIIAETPESESKKLHVKVKKTAMFRGSDLT